MTRRMLMVLGPLLLTGCGGMIGGASAGLSASWIMPDVMQSGDVGVGCAVGEALGPMIAGFRGVSRKAARASVLPQLSAGMCMEEQVWDAELSGARAYFKGDAVDARDELIRGKRLHEVAARRYLEAYERLETYLGLATREGECPKLKTESDQLSYLLGLSAGVLAVLHDMGADNAAGVPLTIPSDVVRSAACLDDAAWWGVPSAMQASIWALQPGAPGASDPWQTFEAAVATGRAAHVRLAGAFQVQSASVVGQDDRMREAIVTFAADRETPSDPAYSMLDEYAGLLVRHESDRIWMAETGHRTPFGALGTFPMGEVDDEPLPDLDFDDLLGE